MKTKIKFSEKRNDVILVQDRISKTNKYSLRPALRARRITPWSAGVQPIPAGAAIINFGGGALPNVIGDLVRGGHNLTILNPPDKVAISANKLRTFELLKAANVPTVRWTVQQDDVEKWIDKGHKVLARMSLASSGGRGIRVVSEKGSIDKAPLYTRYFPKTHEFRVHVVGGEAIDITEKKLRNELKDKRDSISIVRSHGNGWVHAHDALSVGDVADMEKLKKLAVDAIRAVGIDFGAVDILACLDDNSPRRLSKVVVCEVNSAPGIENEVTRNAYVAALNQLISKKKEA